MENLSLTSGDQENNKSNNQEKNNMHRDKQLQERWCNNIPHDVLGEILSYLVAGDEAVFRSVSKTWRRCLKPLPPLPSPFDYADSLCPLLCLFPTSTRPKSLHFFHPIHNSTYPYEKIPRKVSNSVLYYYRYGWLLLGQSYQLFFFHLLTKRIIVLPTTPERLDLVAFTSSPSSPDCLVVGIASMPLRIGFLCTYRLGKDEWETYSVDVPMPFYRGGQISPVFHNGFFYWMDIKGCLLKFDPSSDNPRKGCITYKSSGFGFPQSARQTFMLEKEGELLAVIVPNSTEDALSVYKWDDKARTFVAVESLENYTLFVSRGGSFSEKAMVRGMGNKIFSPTFFSKNGPYAFYSLGSKRYHSFSSHQSSSFKGTITHSKVTQICNSFWFRPY